MPRDDSVTFKIFFNDTNGTIEVKKFVIDGDTSIITNFLFIREKLITVFPRLRDAKFKITWRDAEGDDIILENDEDLILAFTEMDGPLKVLSLTVLEASASSPPLHHNIICDVCNKKITAYRYKCLQCPDYDLCNDCEHAGHHSHHMMLRTSTPELPFERCGRRIFDQVNKAMKKASHMAYKDYRRKPRCDKKKCDKPGETSGDGFSKKDGQDQSCPFEDYVPHFYPFMANIASQANAAMSAAHASASSAAAGVKQPEGQARNAPEGGEEHNPASQFMEAVRNVLSSFVIPQTPPTNESTQPKPNGGNENPQSEQPNNQNVAPTAPKPTNETHIDLTTSTSEEPMDVSSSQRETGWTILTHDDQQTLFPVLTPTVTPVTPIVQPTQPRVVQTPVIPIAQPFPSQPQQQTPQFPQQVQQIPPQQQTPQFPQQAQQIPPQQQPQQPQQPQPNIYPQLFQPQFPTIPIQDPKIAAGLRQLFEMGFTDEQSLIALLKRFNGNVDEVIRNIFERK